MSDQRSGATLTLPVIGGRVGIDIHRDGFVMANGNVCGYGADNESFTFVL